MARKNKHDQQAIPDLGYRCNQCKGDRCLECFDVTRISFGFGDPLCQCKRADHARVIELAQEAVKNKTHRSTEPRDRQILDPETDTVYAPGLSVSIEGDVSYG